MNTSLVLVVEFTDEWYAVDIDFDRHDEAIDLMLDIPFVKEVCLNHQCWVKAEGFDSDNWKSEASMIQRDIRAIIKRVSS